MVPHLAVSCRSRLGSWGFSEADTLNPLLGSLAKDPKATEDFSKEVEELLSRVDTMATAGRVEEAVEQLLSLEKKTRQVRNALDFMKSKAFRGLGWHLDVEVGLQDLQDVLRGEGVDEAEGEHHHAAEAPWFAPFWWIIGHCGGLLRQRLAWDVSLGSVGS